MVKIVSYDISDHLPELELANHPYNALIKKPHKICKVIQLQSSQKHLDMSQRGSRCFWAVS